MSRKCIIRATEIKLCAERKAGEILKVMPKNEGTRLNGEDAIIGAIVEPPKTNLTFAKLGVTKKTVGLESGLDPAHAGDSDKAHQRPRLLGIAS